MSTMAEVLAAHWSASTHTESKPVVDKCDGCGAVVMTWGTNGDMPALLAAHQAEVLQQGGVREDGRRMGRRLGTLPKVVHTSRPRVWHQPVQERVMNPEAIEAAAKAEWARHGPSMPHMTWETEYADYKNYLRASAEAALEAAAPYLIRDARAAELEAAAEHEASRSQTFMNTMEHMVESREYDHDDIMRYGAYSAEAQTSAYRLRRRADAIRAGHE